MLHSSAEIKAHGIEVLKGFRNQRRKLLDALNQLSA
jgi:hypothetical protein